MKTRHFISLLDLSPQELHALIKRAIELKKNTEDTGDLLKTKVLGMFFEKSSTRTRVSFEVGMAQFGGSAIFLSPRDTQFGRGEPIEDSARVMSSMVDCVMLRTDKHSTILKFAEYSDVPVINGLSDLLHPCQLLADMQTFFELRGNIEGKKIAWIGDGNNMCHSYINAARQLKFDLHISTPKDYQPDKEIVAAAGDSIKLFESAEEAAYRVDLIVTDVWASMGHESEKAKRLSAFEGYQVNKQLMGMAKESALFMHCLPAHRGEEVSAEVIDGPQSAVWQEAANRLHSQKALLEFLLVR